MSTSDADRLAAWEGGKLTETEAIELFQELADTGAIWELSRDLQEMAWNLAEAGLLVFPDQPHYETQ